MINERILINPKFHIEHIQKINDVGATDKSQEPNKAVLRTSVITLQGMIDQTFKQQLKHCQQTGKQNFKLGDPILAQMSGYSPWPGRIEGFTKDKKFVKCYFYGSHNRGSVNVLRAIPFVDAFQCIRLLVLRKQIGHMKDFVKGIKELEIKHGVPISLSSLRELDSLE